MRRASVASIAIAPIAIASIAIASALLLGCGSSIPVPITGPHIRGEEPVPIPYPPPPARVEIVGPRPANIPGAVWIDGEWQWKGRRWVWKAGLWEAPLPGGYYALPTTVRFDDGTLEYYEGGWRTAPTRKK